jgi:NADP-dependent 3-hydroxy acid dehydrogenase YdfG
MPSILITGASSGIGRATTQKFLNEGWHVGLLARRADKLSEIADGNQNAEIYAVDVTNRFAVDKAVSEFAKSCGRLDAIFNNAGVFPSGAVVDEITDEDWLTTVNVNLTGMFYTARAAFAQMRKQTPQGGRIINNGSISARTPREGSLAYTATKHAITGMTKSIGLDGRPLNIVCSQIDIGNARTEIVEAIAAAAATPPPMMDVRHAADAVFHMANLPLDVNVQTMTIMANQMPYLGRG